MDWSAGGDADRAMAKLFDDDLERLGDGKNGLPAGGGEPS